MNEEIFVQLLNYTNFSSENKKVRSIVLTSLFFMCRYHRGFKRCTSLIDVDQHDRLWGFIVNYTMLEVYTIILLPVSNKSVSIITKDFLCHQIFLPCECRIFTLVLSVGLSSWDLFWFFGHTDSPVYTIISVFHCPIFTLRITKLHYNTSVLVSILQRWQPMSMRILSNV